MLPHTDLMVAGLFKHSPAIRVRGIQRHPPSTSLLREERRNFPAFAQIRTETRESSPLYYHCTTKGILSELDTFFSGLPDYSVSSLTARSCYIEN